MSSGQDGNDGDHKSAPQQLPLPRTTGQWHKVADATDLTEGALCAVTCAGRSVCLVRHQGKVLALDDLCPHQGAPLSTGWVDEGHIVCAWHGWAFELVTGAMAGTRGDGPAVIIHQVEERDDGIYIRLPIVGTKF